MISDLQGPEGVRGEFSTPAEMPCAGREAGPDLWACPLAELGPAPRDEEIMAALYFGGESELALAWQHGLAPRTVRNIARATLKQVARRQGRWDRMTLDELIDEETRLRRLLRQAEEAWGASREPLRKVRTVEGRGRITTKTTTIPRAGEVRCVGMERRLLKQLQSLGTQLDLRCAAELAAEARRQRMRARTVPRRTRRRKSLGGSRLRLPRLVRTAPAGQPADAAGTCLRQLPRKKAGTWGVGIPPPGRLGGPTSSDRAGRVRAGQVPGDWA